VALTPTAVKRVLVGKPRSSRELRRQLLPKWMALPVFSSDPMSSVAYATEEMMLVLALAGASAFSLLQPLAAAVAGLMIVVVVSYRQTVRAYPHGGGAYIVARENLGELPGLLAGGSLLIDYVLTVAVSIAAGVAAIASAVPAVAEHRVAVALLFVALVTLANLRGVREAGALFAIPTYLFVVTMLVLIASGLYSCTFTVCPSAPTAGTELPVASGLTLFLVLRAFASGATALTGVEAITNGVTAFRYPQSRNAAATLAVMGALSVPMFLGISHLAHETGVVASEGMERTVVAQIALAVFGDGPLFLLVQIVTVAILVLAANTAFADFPRLASVLAKDRFLPHQFVSRGDRLVFSNGVLLLAAAAGVLLVVFGAEVTRLIQLYVVGVFTSFTLSQTGMCRHHLRLREPGWQRSLVVNGVGAATTGVVLVVVAVTKFTGGAWIVLIAIPSVAWLMTRIRGHYQQVSLLLRAGIAQPARTRRNHMVLVLDGVDEAAARALSYARRCTPRSVSAIGMALADPDLERRWADLAPGVPLEVLPVERRAARAFSDALERKAAAHPDHDTTALIPETLSAGWVQQLREHRLALRLKGRLLRRGRLVVTDLTSPSGGPGPYTVEEPAEHHVVVLVSAVNQATMRALSYADGLGATSIRALSVNLDVERSSSMLAAWEDWGVEVALEVVDSPYRSLIAGVRSYLKDFEADGRSTMVTCVLPEFTLRRWYHQPLHNQSALLIKSVLLFERGVVTTSVPYDLGRRLDEAAAEPVAGQV